MTKKIFLDKLNDLLKLLADDERQRIIKKYNLKIEKELKGGKKEAEIIESFGDLNLLATSILKDYKINDQYLNKLSNQSSKENVVFSIIDNIVLAVKGIVHQINEQSLKKVIEIILYFVILLFFLFILKIPFLIIEGLSLFALSFINFSVSNFFMMTFKLLLDFIYFLSIIYFLIVIYNHRSKLFDQPSLVNKKNIMVDKNKPPITNSKSIFELVTIIFQVFIVIITLPLLAILIFLIITAGLFLGLLIKGFIIPSLIIIVVSLIVILGSIIGLIYWLTFKREGHKNE